MADINEELIKEAIRKAEEAAKAEKANAEKANATKANVENAAAENPEAEAGDAVTENAEASSEEAVETTAEDEVSEELVDETEGDASAEGKKKVSLFSKKDKKDKRDEQIAELNDKILRNLAEFENYRKRTEKEKAQMFEIGAKSIVEKILPTIDNFERGLATIPEDKKEDPFVQGMEKVYRQMLSSLEDAGVKAIEAVGQEFDPNLHNAVMHEDNDELGENVVSAELQKGYMYRDTVIRHSMVKVAN